MNSRETQKKKIRISIALCAGILFLLSIVMVWGISSSWGRVKMQRTIFTYGTEDASYTGSAVVMTPKHASESHKVPGVLIYGGASSYSYSLKSYGIELGRRGYCVVLCDMPGQGLSNAIGHSGGYQNYSGKEGNGPGTGEDVTAYTKAVTDYISSLNYVDTDHLTVAGFSAGQGWAVQTALWNPDVYQTAITLSGYRPAYQAVAREAGVNFIGIKGDGSPNPMMCPEYEMVDGAFTGSGTFENSTADYCYNHPTAVQHQMQPIHGGLITAIIEALHMASPTDTTLASNNLTYMGAELWSAAAIVSLFVLITCLLHALLTMDYFKSLIRPAGVSYPSMCAAGSDTRSRIKSIAYLSFRTIIVIVLYEIFAARTQMIPLFHGTRWAGLWINIWVPFLIANMVVNLIIFLIWHIRHGKPHGGNAYNYELSWGSAQRNAENIGKCLLLGAAMVFVIPSLLSFLDNLLAINLKVMIFGMITFNMEHMLQMPAYILLYFALLFCASLTQYITNPAYDDGTSKGQLIATARTTFIAILPYLVLCVWNTLKGMNMIVMANTYTVDAFAPLDNLYGYPIMMALITPVMDVLHRKTKSVWPGIIVCAMLLGVLICCNYSLNETWFG